MWLCTVGKLNYELNRFNLFLLLFSCLIWLFIISSVLYESNESMLLHVNKVLNINQMRIIDLLKWNAKNLFINDKMPPLSSLHVYKI